MKLPWAQVAKHQERVNYIFSQNLVLTREMALVVLMLTPAKNNLFFSILNIVALPDRFYEQPIVYQDIKNRVCGTYTQTMATMT